MTGTRFLLVVVIIALSFAVGYVRDRKYKLITMIALGLAIAYYLAQSQGG